MLAGAVEGLVHQRDRSGVRWVVVGNASAALHTALLDSFPPLRGVALDTRHHPMKYEAVAPHHRSAGSLMLRRIVSKFNVPLPPETPADVLEPFRGDQTRAPAGNTSTPPSPAWEPSESGPWPPPRLCTLQR